MNASSHSTPAPKLAVHGARASSVIVHPVPEASVKSFMEWQRGITQAAEAFPGYQATEVYPPADGQHKDWVIVVHFDNAEALQRWLDSPARAEHVAKLPAEIRDFQLTTLTSGFGPWFAGQARGADAVLPPAWKMVMIVVLGLYPTVVFLTFTVGLITDRLLGVGFALSLLIGNACSCSLLQWVVMPPLQRRFTPWLQASPQQSMAVHAGGAILILVLLAVLAVVSHIVFHLVNG